MKVIIIGAGIAGISAAHLLEERGVEYRLIEASANYGGRIKKTDMFEDFPIDLGAEWIHRIIMARPKLMEELLSGNSKTFKTLPDSPKSIYGWKFNRLWNISFINKLFSFGDHKFVSSSWYDYISTIYTETIKSKAIYNSPVKFIRYDTDKVKVSCTDNQEFEADKVIITVPIKILQGDSITFVPAIPTSQRKEIQKETMRGGIKVFIEFSNKFYPDLLFTKSLLTFFVNGEHIYYNATLNKNTDKNVLGLFVEGKRSEEYTLLSDEEVLAKLLNDLDKVFDGQASKYYMRHIVQNWTNETYIRGAYSHLKGNPKKMGAPIDNKIFFAGEAMNKHRHPIAVHSACESAYTAIDEIFNGI